MSQDRRLGILGLVVLLVFGVAWGRAAWLTTVDASSLQSKLADNRQPVTIPAPRGTITDKKGLVLAISEVAADVSASPRMIKDAPGVAAKLAPLVGVPVDELTAKLSTDKGFVYVARLVPESRAKQIRALGIDGIDLTPTTRRQYPQETVASQLIGFAGTDGQGLSGIEVALEKVLRGKDGRRLLVRGRGGKDAKVVYIRDETQTVPGHSVKLTLDAHIQNRAEEALASAGARFGAKGATAIVMQPSTGNVLAMASWPRVDANKPNEAPESARQISATGFTFEPGSTFKAFTVAGALEEREVTPDTMFTLPPTIQFADRTIGESHPRGTIQATTSDIIAQSSNVGTIKIGLRLGKVRFDRWIRKFGFGESTGVETNGEETGKLLDVPDYSDSSMGNLPIGQGELVTPMQLATGYATLANDGIRRQPTVIAAINGKSAKRAAGTRVVSAETARELRTMLTRVTEAGGTASDAAIPGYDVAAKTGTANKVEPGTAEYSKTRYASSLIGMAPADRPKIVVAVIVDEPTKGGYYGAVVAGPAFQDLTRWTLNYLGVAPN